MSSKACLLVNLGTPARPTPQGVRAFLRPFLSDRRVVNLPRLFWFPILYGIILPLRSPRVAALYKKIWWPEGSPLEVITRRQVSKLQQRLASDIAVRHAMVYGEPSLAQAVRELQDAACTDIVVLPLYPQYCSATNGSVEDQLLRVQRAYPRLRLSLVSGYHNHPRYIEALAASASRHWQQQGQPQKLLFSFHGIPQALADSGDPYYRQCHETAAAVAARLQLAPDFWQVCFQSRFGKAEWVKPYTDLLIDELAVQGVKRIDVMTPAFASDCLETLEEIAVQNAEAFIHAGGERLSLIPCLNESDEHITLLAELFSHKMSGTSH